MASGDKINYVSMRKNLEDFYKEAFPRFYCKGEYKEMTPTYFREPRSLYSMDGHEAKNVEKLIFELEENFYRHLLRSIAL